MRVIDSHTIGEPTRIIVDGGPDLGKGPLPERASILQGQYDHIRRSVCLEPRGHDAMVGGLLCEAHDPSCHCGIIFFNNAGNLGMCIHGTIGLIATLRHLGRLPTGPCRIETPVGIVEAHSDESGRTRVTNVLSYRTHTNVEIHVPGWGPIHGDVAWGGNWFFLVDGQGPILTHDRVSELTTFANQIRNSLKNNKINGPNGEEIDHIELFQAPHDPSLADSRNFVLCPGGAYDRSPCGTGVSAKLACLAASGKLSPGQVWRQASILNQTFEGSYQWLDESRILPTISGQAWIIGESTYHFDPSDPFRHGF